MIRSILVALALCAASPAPAQSPRSAFAEPGISPDGREIAFVSGGDIWTVGAGGGEARLLVSHQANETRPLYSPDGTRLAFVSNRSGNGDIYVLTLASGSLKRITFDDQLDQLSAWSADGRWLYFHSTSRDIAGMNDVWRVRAEGGTPMQVSADRYAAEFSGAPHPDGRSMAVVARGFGVSQWWRKGRSHLDESELWMVRWDETSSTPRFEQMLPRGAKQLWPMWSPDGRTLYYMSDRSGDENLWARDASGATRQLTRFTGGRVLWPSLSADGRTIAFERDLGIWTMPTGGGDARAVAISLRGASAGPAVERLSLTGNVQEMALSPDGRKVAFVVRGEVFAVSTKDGGDAARVSNSPTVEGQLAWAPDSRRIAYASNRDGRSRIYIHDFGTGVEQPLTKADGNDFAPKWSPDGKLIAFQRGARELMVIDANTRAERRLAEGSFSLPPFVSTRSLAWSPDSRWLAYLGVGTKQFTNVWVVPAAGGSPRQVSYLANAFANTLSWSPDGTFLLYSTAQRTERGALARVDIVPRTPRFREDQFRDLFREQTPAIPGAPAPNAPRRDTAATRDTARRDTTSVGQRRELVFEGVRERLSLLPVGVDVGYQVISPDGKSVLMIAGAAGQENLYTYSLDELSREQPVARQLTSTSGGKGWAQWAPDGKEVVYVEQGRLNAVTVETRATRAIATTAEMDLDFGRDKMEVFAQGWSYLRDNFYDDKYHGVNWASARERYEPYIAGARTPDEVRRIMSLMVGELNASHLGVTGPPAQPPHTARLGLRFDRVAYERDGRLRVSRVIPLSPAALAPGVDTGTVLLAVDGVSLGSGVNLDSLLAYKTGRRVTLRIEGPGAARDIVVRPVDANTEKGLLYRNWVEEKRAYVARVSGGRLGYAHMFDMGDGSLNQLFVDLDAENHAREGVVVDVRNNNGGFVNAYALDVFARRPYLTMTVRGFGAAPGRSVLGQRALEAPTVLVINQHSLSDAEDFTEGYKAMRLGKVIGEPTSGWIIYTWNVGLSDGTTLRLPRQRVTTAGGEEMELRPRTPDVRVERPLGESYTGRDSQLDAAVRELLNPATSMERPR